MDVDTVELFTSLLALVALGGAMLLVVARVLAQHVPIAREAGATVADAGPWLAFLVAAGATSGSLYFSEVADYVPCRLCWFQRTAMYPLAVILLVAAIRRDRGARFYVVPIAAVGSIVASYHYLLEWKPSLEGGACSAVGPACADIWFRELGFVTLAFMALAGFISIIVFSLVSFPPAGDPDHHPANPRDRTELP
ncbi:MAG: disulfide bond formation protein B [Ilumatobacteraceae bacterium]